MKKIFPKLALLISCLAICNSCGKTNNTNNNFTPHSYFEFSNIDNGYSVKLKSVPEDGVVIIPSTYNGKKVIEIQDEGFLEFKNLIKVVIPNTVSSIGWNAFNRCSSLTSIVIPNSVTSIGSNAFAFCKSLTSIVIPNSVSSIGYGVFSNCSSLTSVVFSNSISYIAEYAFEDCISLSSFVISNSVKKIGFHAFEGCMSLTSIFIPESVSSIGDDAFDCPTAIIYCEASEKPSEWDYGWRGITAVYWGVSQEDIIYQNELQFLIIDGKAVVTGHTNKLPNSVIIPSSITIKGTKYSVSSIGDNAFYFCESLTSFVIPDSVSSIGCYALLRCHSLTSIVIPNSVTNMDGFAFYDCQSLKIYCEVNNEPSGWDSSWNHDGGRVYWGGTWSYVNGIPTPN